MLTRLDEVIVQEVGVVSLAGVGLMGMAMLPSEVRLRAGSVGTKLATWQVACLVGATSVELAIFSSGKLSGGHIDGEGANISRGSPFVLE